jgi:non-specific serine/threonine protein kinase
LTRRERQVAVLVAQGRTDRQIAEALVIAEGTVGVHLGNIFTKLDLHSRAELAVWAAEHDLLPARPD